MVGTTGRKSTLYYPHMFGQKRSEVEAQKKYDPKKDPKSIFFETKFDRFSNKYYTFLKVLFLAWNTAYLDHEDITTALERIPQKIEAAMSSGEARKAAEEAKAIYQEKMDKGEPLPVDLISFYLEQEHLTAGVSDETITKARAHFDALMEAAKRQQAMGWSREQTIGWVLKQQGEYDDSQALLSDLLTTGRGQCQARMRFITAAMQVLYPEDVAAGKLKIESFRDHIDENGVLQHGHVRAVFDEGDHVDVLEGDVIHRDDDVEKHRNIGEYEATAMAVKSLAVSQGIDTFAKEESSKEKKIARQQRQNMKHLQDQSPSSVIENLSKGLHDTLANDAIGAYPTGTELYGDGRDHMNVDPHPVSGNNYALSHEDWPNGVHGEFRVFEKKVPMTIHNFQTAFSEQTFYMENGRAKIPIFLDRFSTFDSDAVIALLQERQRRINQVEHFPATYPLVVKSNQKIDPKAFLHAGAMDWELHGDVLPEIGSILTKSVTVQDAEKIPAGLDKISWSENRGSLHVSFDGRQIAAVNGLELRQAIEGGLRNITLDGGPSQYAQPIVGLSLAGMDLHALTLKNIQPSAEESWNGLHVASLEWSSKESFPTGALTGVVAENMRVVFSRHVSNPITELNTGEGWQGNELKRKKAMAMAIKPYSFDGSVFRDQELDVVQSDWRENFQAKNITILTEDHDGAVWISAGAFRGMNVDSLTIGNGVTLGESALENAEIGTLMINGRQTDPLTKSIDAKALSKFGGVERVIVIQQDEHVPLDGDSSRFKGIKGENQIDIMIGVNNEHLAEFRKKSGVGCPIYVIMYQKWLQLKREYPHGNEIPKEVLVMNAFMIDYGN